MIKGYTEWHTNLDVRKGYKLCKKCGEERRLKFFNKNKGCKGGRIGTCTVCKAAWSRHYYKENKNRLECWKPKGLTWDCARFKNIYKAHEKLARIREEKNLKNL